MTENAFMPARVISGKNCVVENAAILSSFGKKCLVVTGKSSAKLSGAFDDAVSALESQGIGYAVFDEISQNPLASSVIKGGESAREFGAEFILGIGGGSPLDSAKAIALCAENPQFDIDGLYNRKIPSSALPVVLIGTTSGTGSEVTGVSVLTNDKNMTKKSISGADCYAAVSFLDPRYTYSVGFESTVSTALDAFAHATESRFSPKCGLLAEQYCNTALPLIYKGLCELRDSGGVPCEATRDALYYGSIWAGMALNICGAAFPHTVGYILTENFGIPHGRACTAFFEPFIKRAKTAAPNVYAEYLEAVGADEKSLVELIKSLTDVHELEMTDTQISEWCARYSGNVKNFLNTPGGYARSDAESDLADLRK